MKKNFTFSLTEELVNQIKDNDQVNWSAYIRLCVELKIKQTEKSIKELKQLIDNYN